MEADVRAAEAAIILAHKARLPDFSLGLMADVKTNPTLYRPLGDRCSPPHLARQNRGADCRGAGQQARGRGAALGRTNRAGGGFCRQDLPVSGGHAATSRC